VFGGCVRYIEGVAWGKDPLKLGVHLTVYVALVWATLFVFSGLLLWLGGKVIGVFGTTLLSAVFANWLTLRIYEDRHVVDIGLWANRISAENLVLGLAGGAGSAALVLLPPLLTGAAHLTPTPCRRIAAAGSAMEHHQTAAIGHFFFAQGFRSSFGGLLATHPPLEERIRAIEPQSGGNNAAPSFAARDRAIRATGGPASSGTSRRHSGRRNPPAAT